MKQIIKTDKDQLKSEKFKADRGKIGTLSKQRSASLNKELLKYKTKMTI